MKLPRHLDAILEEGINLSEESYPLFRVEQSRDQVCEGAMYHTPRPLVLMHVLLIPTDWLGDLNGEKVWLCGTCRENLEVYQALLWRYDGELPWPLKREFGNMIRALGDRSWFRYQESRKVMTHG